VKVTGVSLTSLRSLPEKRCLEKHEIGGENRFLHDPLLRITPFLATWFIKNQDTSSGKTVQSSPNS
jgi:hypothetical protein